MTVNTAQNTAHNLDRLLAEALTTEAGVLPRVCATSPVDREDRFRTLLRIYDLLLGPLSEDGVQARLATHPAVGGLKWRLENQWLEELSEHASTVDGVSEANAVEGIRMLAANDSRLNVYRWLAKSADREQVAAFMLAEGGPSGALLGVTDPVHLGLGCEDRLELAQTTARSWGNASPEAGDAAHFRDALSALGLPEGIDRSALTLHGLERAALAGLLATNHWLQPEMLGALGVIEVQGPTRSKLVASAMTRLRFPADAIKFYQAHGRNEAGNEADWPARVLRPILRRTPAWHYRVLRGARWQLALNDVFLTELHQRLVNGSFVLTRKAA